MRTIIVLSALAAAAAATEGETRRALRAREDQQVLVPRALSSPPPGEYSSVMGFVGAVAEGVSTGAKGLAEGIQTGVTAVSKAVSVLPSSVWESAGAAYTEFMNEYGELPKSINAGLLVVQVARYQKLPGADKVPGEKMMAAATEVLKHTFIQAGVDIAVHTAEASLHGATHGASILLKAALEAYKLNKSTFDGIVVTDTTPVCKTLASVHEEAAKLKYPATGDMMEEVAAIKAGVDVLKRQLKC